MGQRPPHVKAPTHWKPGPPAPQPAPLQTPLEESDGSPDRTRYGDWERNGIAVDF